MAHARFALAEPQLVKQASHVIAIVVHAKLRFDDRGHARRRPVIIGKTESHGPLAINLRYPVQLLPGKAAGPAGGLAALE